MDLTNYYELKHQPHNLRLLTDSLGGAGLTGVGGAGQDDRLALPPSSCTSSSAAAGNRARSPLRASSRLSAASGGEAAAVMLPHHFLDGAPPKTAVISGADGRLSDHHLEELYKERLASFSLASDICRGGSWSPEDRPSNNNHSRYNL